MHEPPGISDLDTRSLMKTIKLLALENKRPSQIIFNFGRRLRNHKPENTMQ